MRYLVLTDIHANLEALDTCLSDARSRKYDSTLCLGHPLGSGGGRRDAHDAPARLEVPAQSWVGRPAARQRSARGVRDRRYRSAVRRIVPPEISGGSGAGKDSGGGSAGRVGAAAGGGSMNEEL